MTVSHALPTRLLEHSPVRIIFGSGTFDKLGQSARDESATRVLVVTDPGIRKAGHVDRGLQLLEDVGLAAVVYDGVCENPTTLEVEAGVQVARESSVDLIVGIGGGSAMDCAKAINLVLSNGGTIGDYSGVGKAVNPMLPMIAVPTTAGTGSEAQSFALISDPVTHLKSACGDRRLPIDGGLRPRVAILDPDLTASQPRYVAACSGLDAIAHAVETAGSNVRTETSRELSREAWRLLQPHFENVVASTSGAGGSNTAANDESRSSMLLGAHIAGAAIEHSMLGAAHACANPLTAKYGIVHGAALAVVLPAVIRHNAADGINPYADLLDNAEELARIIEGLVRATGLPSRLVECDVPKADLPIIASEAARQWTASFNPRLLGETELLQILEAVYE